MVLILTFITMSAVVPLCNPKFLLNFHSIMYGVTGDVAGAAA
jgi:hypothetical protein